MPTAPITKLVETELHNIGESLQEARDAILSDYSKSMIVACAIIRFDHIIRNEFRVSSNSRSQVLDQKYRLFRKFFDIEEIDFAEISQLRNGDRNESNSLAHSYFELDPDFLLEWLDLFADAYVTS